MKHQRLEKKASKKATKRLRFAKYLNFFPQFFKKNQGFTQTQKNSKLNLAFYQTIRFQMVLSYFIPIFFIFILGFASYTQATSAIINRYQSSVKQTMSMMKQYLDLDFHSVLTNYKSYLSEETDLNYYLGGLYDSDSIKQATTYNFYKTKLNAIPTKDASVANIYILSQKEKSITTTSATDSLYEAYAKDPQGSIVAKDKYAFHWFGNTCDADSVLKTSSKQYSIRLARHYALSNSILIVDFAPSVVADSLKSLSSNHQILTALVTSDQKQYSLSTQKESSFASLDAYKQALKGKQDNGFSYISYKNQSYLFLYQKLKEDGVMICSLIPKEYIVAQADSIRKLTIHITVIAILLSLFVSNYISRRISGNIKRFTHQIKKVATGDMTVTFHTKQKNEFCILAFHLNQMVAHTNQLISAMQSIHHEISSASDQLNNFSNSFEQQFNDIHSAIGGITDGNTQLKDDSCECLIQMESLSHRIGDVNTKTNQVTQLANNTSDVVKNATQTIDSLQNAYQETKDVSLQVIDSVSSLKEQSKSIFKIVNSIHEIAEQTSLLSLNASIEAAKAGDSGKSFSIIASEIRSLADDSVEFAHMIEAIVASIEEKTNDVSSIAKHASDIIGLQEASVFDSKTAFIQIKEHMQQLQIPMDSILQSTKNMKESKTKTLHSVENISSISSKTLDNANLLLHETTLQKEDVSSLSSITTNLKAKSDELSNLLNAFTSN